MTFDALTQVGLDGRALPRLAKSWKWEVGERRLRIVLHDNVSLHDGRRLDAQMAAEALAIMAAKRSTPLSYPALRDVVGAIPASQFELIIELSRRSSQLPEDLSALLDLPTGPYRPVRRSGSSIELERFEPYYLGRPAIGRVVLQPSDTLRTTWANLLRGELDMVYDVPADAIDFIRNDDVQVVSVPRPYQFVVAFNSRKGPLRSPLVRKALNLAIDRQALIERVFNGRGTPSTGPLSPRFWAYDNHIAPYQFDPGQAAALLDEAGYPIPAQQADVERPNSRLRFVSVIPEGLSVWERIALEVQRDLFNVGVDMQFKVIPFDALDAHLAKGDFEAAILDMISGPTPARPFMFWGSAQRLQGQFNVFGYENADAERMFDALRTSTNEAAVRSATSRLQRIMIEDPPALFIAWSERARAIARDIVVPKSEGPDLIRTLWSWTRQSSQPAPAQ